MSGWEASDFLNGGEPRVEDGSLVIPTGELLSGVTWTRDFPAMDYEIRLDAMRVSGSDFFCGLTFPVGDSFASLILGGWGGTTCGISSLDGQDAAHNETTSYRTFESGRWYAVRLRVTPGRIEAWLDGEKIVAAESGGRRVAIRPDIAASTPLGLATYQTTAVLRNVEWRPIAAAGGAGGM